jgi:hypothetical protein
MVLKIGVDAIKKDKYPTPPAIQQFSSLTIDEITTTPNFKSYDS